MRAILAAGASAPGIPAPSDRRAKGNFQQTSGELRREIAKSYLPFEIRIKGWAKARSSRRAHRRM
jgi:hypothetical protein